MQEIETIIQNYFQGTTSEEENKALLLWLDQSPDNRKSFFREKDIWDTYGYQADYKKYPVGHELQKLLERTQKPVRRIYPYTLWLKVAALLILTFGLGWFGRFMVPSGVEEPLVEVSISEIAVPKGQVNQVFLADGTRIWVNSETRLFVPSQFTGSERRVKLSGEAYFEVAENRNMPFLVELDGQVIEVLGTAFNVRAYNNSEFIETTLAEGKISLTAGGKSYILYPGDQAMYFKKSGEVTLEKVDPEIFSAWKDGRFEFQNENLAEVFRVVERWYDVEISYDRAWLGNLYFSGVIKRNKDARHFLELLNLSVPIRYIIKGDKIEIYSKKQGGQK